MSKVRIARRLGAALALPALALPAIATTAAHGGDDLALLRAQQIRRDTGHAVRRAQSEPLLRPSGAAAKLQLEGGDLLSASKVKDRVVQIKGAADKTVYARLQGAGFVPRGVAYDDSRGLVAIAAVSQVLLFAPASGEVTVIPGPPETGFGFANDVVFEPGGGLVIADEGAETITRHPADGSIWRYDLDSGELAQIATSRELSNPKLLAVDKSGVIHFIDGGAGPLVSPAFGVRWDRLYRIEGKKLGRAKIVWNKPGIQATAYAIDRGGWHWIVNVGELVRIKGHKFQQPCLPPYPFQFATGMTIAPDGTAWVLDGADVLTRNRAIYGLDSDCTATLRTDHKLKGARGLAQVAAE